ncbi:STAS domain-containing protein [Cryptosporangium phraense]|uniref:STAS domain-containing protein n=1 Tax=Cryptosporangium phraense TaxID=2593070 RepID=A0A545AP10_9ACTN|nr:STAS domain-containing protein [Cryptosporangium phraense]TQS43026.1 STAS domain-containing protein [Cryptosporangium phraense]
MTDHHVDHINAPTPPHGIRLPDGQALDDFVTDDGRLLLTAYTRADADSRRAVLQLLGGIDALTVPWFRERLDTAITMAGRPGTVYVDLHSVTFLSAAGAGLLGSSNRGGTELVVSQPSPLARRVLTLTGLAGALRIDPAEPPL